MENSKVKTEIGVIIGRFQVPKLHEAHRDLIRTVLARHPKVLILLGNTPTLVTRKNPFDYQTRQLMLSKDPEFEGKIAVLPIKDMASDFAWSKEVDKRIREVHQMGDVILYGSRDGFIPHYNGEFKTQELESTHPQISGEEIRRSVSNTIKETEDFRLGVIYAAYNKYPTVYSTVDVAIFNEDKTKLLLGHKKTDEAGKWRFIGGFIQKGETSEEAARRETAEETKITIDDVKYIGTQPIDDWRYRNSEDSILTTLFSAKYIYGKETPSDDIDELKWFNLVDLIKTNAIMLVEEHKKLFQLLNSHLEKEKDHAK